MRKTKVYIDVFYYGAALSGIKTYIEELVSGLYKYGSNDIDYIFSHDIKSQRKKRFFINSKYKFFRWIFQFLYFFWKQVILPSKLFFNKADILICPDYIAPVLSPCRKIVVIHDNLFWKYPNDYPYLWRKYFITLIQLGLSRNAEIVTTSRYSKDGLKKIFNININYVYQSSDFMINNFNDYNSKKYFLHIGTFERRKDLITLVKAFKLFKVNIKSDYKLILAGSKHINGNKKSYQEIKKYILKNNLNSEVLTPGYINKKQAISYYNNAYAYIFPSLDEGFGIPLVEAMKTQVPIICSDIKIFKEIGDDSVIYFKKNNYNDLFNKLKLIFNNHDLIKNLKIKSSKRARLFNQKNFVQGFEKLY